MMNIFLGPTVQKKKIGGVGNFGGGPATGGGGGSRSVGHDLAQAPVIT